MNEVVFYTCLNCSIALLVALDLKHIGYKHSTITYENGNDAILSNRTASTSDELKRMTVTCEMIAIIQYHSHNMS